MTTGDKPRIDTSVAHPARRYNYWLGGKDHFAVDRESGDRIEKAYPDVVTDAKGNRAWMHRVARCLARERGIDQFVDVGVGLPVSPNLHEIVQAIEPTSRIVYVDNDPLVMTHARALLTSTIEGATAYAEVDMRNCAAVLELVGNILDLTRPVALLYCAVLHFEEDDTVAYDLVARTLHGLPSGSCLAVSNFTLDGLDAHYRNNIEQLRATRPHEDQIRPRTRGQVARFFDGLTLVAPGISLVSAWRPDLAGPDEELLPEAHVYGGVGLKPR